MLDGIRTVTESISAAEPSTAGSIRVMLFIVSPVACSAEALWLAVAHRTTRTKAGMMVHRTMLEIRFIIFSVHALGLACVRHLVWSRRSLGTLYARLSA